MSGLLTSDRLTVCGLVIHLRTNHTDARQLLLRLYETVAEPCDGGSVVEVTLEDYSPEGFVWSVGRQQGETPDLAGSLWAVEAALCQTILLAQTHQVALHAATLFTPSASILLAGRSGAGKSLLSVSLALQGLPIGSDDVTLLNPDTLALYPLPRCFHLDDSGVELLEEAGNSLPDTWQKFRFLVPSHLHRVSGAAPPTRLLIFIDASGPRVSSPELVPVSQAEMVALLLSESGQGSLPTADLVLVLSRLCTTAGCYRLIPGPLQLSTKLVRTVIDKLVL